MESGKSRIAVIGGTGDLGSGLARLWSSAGYPIVIGSRAKERAVAAAQQLALQTNADVSGDDNRGAAQNAEVVALCVPYSSHDSIIEEIAPVMAGKILVDAVVPLLPPRVWVVHLPPVSSPALAAQRRLGVEVRVAAAFHNVSAKKLHDGHKADCDVLVFSDDGQVRARIIKLADVIATRGVDGGVLANAIAAEALTSVLIAINRHYKIAGAGIRITGLRSDDAR
jgi:8-hydroxy-5-deazaflavin:NADPH oxidoreductase